MENKKVTYKNLSVGQKINGFIREGLSSSFQATVKNINSAYVTILKWDKYEEKIDSRSLFLVELTEQEFENKYAAKAAEVLKNLKNKLNIDQIGYHEMSNAWLYGTPFEIAQCCIKDHFKVVGYCEDIIPKIAMFTGDTLEVGVCAEYENGERFWCHYRCSDIEKMLKRYKKLLE